MAQHDVRSLYGPVDAKDQLNYWTKLIQTLAKEKTFTKINFDQTKKFLDSIQELPAEADGVILVPKNKTVQLIGYNDWKRKVFGASTKSGKHLDSRLYCRSYRLFKALVKQIVSQKHILSGGVCDYFIGSPYTIEATNMKPDEIERRLFEVLSMRSATSDALKVMEKSQSGPFLVVPYSIAAETVMDWPCNEMARLTGDRFGLTISIILCWVLMRMMMEPVDGQVNFDVVSTDHKFRIDLLGDQHLRWNGSDHDKNGTCIRLMSGSLKLDTLPINQGDNLRIGVGYKWPTAKK